MTSLRTRTLTVAAATVGLVALSAPAAWAHVTVTPDTVNAGAYALLTVGVPHGCEGSSTTKVDIKVPEGVQSIKPSVNPNWDVEIIKAPLAQPTKDSHGNAITERVSQVVYTAKAPLPDALRGSFVLSVKLPSSAGDTLVWPILQTCEVGETAWVEVPADGQKAADLKHPASSFVLTAAASSEEAKVADASTPAVAWVALGISLLALLAGVGAAVNARKKG